MKRVMFLLPGIFFLGLGQAWAGHACSQKTAGRQLCIAGKSMVCAREFNTRSKKFDYVLNGINADGQSFSLESPLYLKVAGYTPATCTDAQAH